ncbi:5-guanidino-2-oxopentanoate decarboxylase [Streptomyces sp. NPDC048479]|uniref:thiamine pyrophosphate-binding protein n=1 Tax=Streptomyces sp. NPDC048479 TaxID=3154725 RepID=UPI00342DD4C8
MSGGQALVRALAAHGVDLVFGIPGTHNLEIYAHLGGYDVTHVTPRHEQGAGYAADAYARTTGRPGVVITTTGPALLNASAAVGQAYSDSVPVLVISPGMPLRHPELATGQLHEMRSQSQAMAAIAAFSHRVTSVAEIDAAVARAFALFRSGRPRPAHIEIPLDLLDSTEAVDERPRTATRAAPLRADAGCLRRAAETLQRAERPGIVLGGGARTAGTDCLRLAEALGAPVVTTANGKGVVPESHPLALGVALHTATVQDWLADCDAVLVVGSELAESDFWRTPSAVGGTLIRADIDPGQMYAGQPADIALVGDAAVVIDDLLALVRVQTASAHRDGAVRSPGGRERAGALSRVMRDKHRSENAARDARWLPYLAAIRKVLQQDAVVTSDSAMCCYYGALPHLPLDPPGRMLHPTGFGTLGYALPAAIGAKVADPDREVVALSGDGGLQFSVQELATAAQLGHPLPVIVFDNGGYGEIRDEMTARGDTPVAVDLPAPDLPALARAYGGQGTRVSTPEALAAALAKALNTSGPTVIVVPEETTP